MDGATVKKLARDFAMPTDHLVEQLKTIGINVESEKDVVTGAQQLRLLKHLRLNPPASSPQKDFTIDDVGATTSLSELNELLTRAMADRKIQGLIKEDNLETITNTVLKFTVDVEQQLLAAAILGRLAAVARGRDSTIFSRANELFTQMPESIESLEDGDAKAYAASMLSHVDAPWVSQYSYREAFVIDTADNARRELLDANLLREESLALWIGKISASSHALKEINSAETRLKRVRRVFSTMNDVAVRWRGDIGPGVGDALAGCLKSSISGKVSDLDDVVLFEALDGLVSVLGRVIELRFSTALYASTYALLAQGRKTLGSALWRRFINASAVISEIRVALLESALVLARQNRTDKQLMAVLVASYSSRPQTAAAINRHFENARDLDPDVADWWRSAGDDSSTWRTVEHKVGNNEDAQIGALLIEVENNREAMEKVGRAVVPLLDISEPVLASIVKKAVDGYQGIAQIARRLARMRKLSKTDLKGQPIEYNPLEHEMLGGHRPGVRLVRVVREGIKKEFGGKDKTLVKPWVEPAEE